MKAFIALYSVASTSDPLTALIARDWASFGGWSLFVMLCLLIVFGSFREMWVPGARVRRLEELAAKQAETINQQTGQIDKLLVANEITKHFFEETTPKRGEAKT